VRRRARKAWDKLGLPRKIGVVVLGLLLAALAYLFVLKWLPEWLTNDDLTGTARAEDEGRNRTAVLATIAGMIAIAGAVFTGLSYRLNRAGQITERFTRAIDQLGAIDESGKPKIDVVLGGIYALERIAKDSRDDHPQVVEVLTAYVREHARYKPAEPQAPTTSGQEVQDDVATIHRGPPLATDIQAAMDVLARRDITQDRNRLNLAGTDLRRLYLDAQEGGHLEGVNLYEAHLEGASLWGAHLEESVLNGAYLTGAGLDDAHLEGATLIAARLQGAKLVGAHLEGAMLFGAQLVEAFLMSAHLERADLSHANLERATLSRSRLEGAKLLEAQLEGASLEQAVYDDETIWPTSEFEAEARARDARHVDDDDEDRSPETD
jgi:hypothetical protein